MPTQFYNAFRALQEKNTSNFNRKYGTKGQQKQMIKSPSQFKLAKSALRSESPVSFNEIYGYTSPKAVGGKRRKTRRRGKKAKRMTRRKV
jgi:hypothetical protein